MSTTIDMFLRYVTIKKNSCPSLKTTRLHNEDRETNANDWLYKVGRVSDIRYCCLQVMYDATGVRLQAGRQAEV